MCGRFTLRTPTKDIVKALALADALDLKPRYNIAPTQQIAAIRLDPETGTRKLSMLRWGLVPSWADDPKIGNSMINARAESVATKPAYRTAFKKAGASSLLMDSTNGRRPERTSSRFSSGSKTTSLLLLLDYQSIGIGAIR